MVFPAHAGMSLSLASSATNWARFPRSRGDEPPHHPALTHRRTFSPLTRG